MAGGNDHGIGLAYPCCDLLVVFWNGAAVDGGKSLSRVATAMMEELKLSPTLCKGFDDVLGRLEQAPNQSGGNSVR